MGLHPTTATPQKQSLECCHSSSSPSSTAWQRACSWVPLALLSITALAACATLRSSTGAGLFSPALAPRAPLSNAAQQLLNGSTIFTLLASASTPGTLSVLRHMQRDLGAHRVFLLFDDTNSAWTALPAVRLTAQRGPAAPRVLLFNRSEADAVAGRMAGQGWQNYYESPSLALLYRHLGGTVPFEHVWRIEVGGSKIGPPLLA